MERELEDVARRLAHISRRRALVRIAKWVAGATTIAVGLVGRAEPAFAANCPQCKNLPTCNGCYFSRCPTGCSWVWSWFCCVSGCMYDAPTVTATATALATACAADGPARAHPPGRWPSLHASPASRAGVGSGARPHRAEIPLIRTRNSRANRKGGGQRDERARGMIGPDLVAGLALALVVGLSQASTV